MKSRSEHLSAKGGCGGYTEAYKTVQYYYGKHTSCWCRSVRSLSCPSSLCTGESRVASDTEPTLPWHATVCALASGQTSDANVHSLEVHILCVKSYIVSLTSRLLRVHGNTKHYGRWRWSSLPTPPSPLQSPSPAPASLSTQTLAPPGLRCVPIHKRMVL